MTRGRLSLRLPAVTTSFSLRGRFRCVKTSTSSRSRRGILLVSLAGSLKIPRASREGRKAPERDVVRIKRSECNRSLSRLGRLAFDEAAGFRYFFFLLSFIRHSRLLATPQPASAAVLVISPTASIMKLGK